MDQGSIDALYQSFRDAAEQGSIDAWYQSFKAAEQRRTDFLCQSLRDAAEQGSIDALYALIRTNADVLDSMDKIPIVETPLHIAASLGHTEFAMEIMKLKPSFARKLNQDGFSPMHLALQKHELEKIADLQRNKTQLLEKSPDLQRNKTQLLEKSPDLQRNQTQLLDHDSENDLQRNLTILVYRLLDVDKDLVRVQGREGVTPLHYVAQIGNPKFLTKFFEVCPESFEDVTIRRETALHVALKEDKVEAFELLLKLLRRAWFKDAKLLEKKVLDWEDDGGNTLLHVAVFKNQHQVVSWLLDSGSVNLKAKNLKGRTVFDILAECQTQTQVDNQLRGIKEMLKRQQRLDKSLRARFVDNFRSPISKLKRCFVGVRRHQTVLTDEKRNALLVVAALLITVTYQLALSPDEQPNKFNCTAPINATDGANHNYHFNCTAQFNGTIGDIKHLHRNKGSTSFLYTINTITYYLTNVILCFLLPPGLIGLMLSSLLGILFFSYFYSILVLSNAPSFYLIFCEFLFLPLIYLPSLTAFTDRPVDDFSSFNIECKCLSKRSHKDRPVE